MSNTRMICTAVAHTTRCRCVARFFGRWTGGGLCARHALLYAEENGLTQFHPEYRDALRTLMEQRRPNGVPARAA